MYKHYLKQMLQLFKENKLVGCISILGTALSICMIMIIVIIYQMNTENMAPETNRDRMLYLNVVTVEGFEDGSRTKGGLSRYLMIEGMNKLQLPEMIVAACNAGDRLMSAPGMKKAVKGSSMLTDAAFWQMFDFTFVVGTPYTEEEFESAMKYVVIDDEYANKLYGSAEDAVGKQIDLNYENYTIKGVVKAISPFFKSTYANVWMPYTTDTWIGERKAMNFAGGYVGRLRCYILASSSSDFDAIKAEVQQVVVDRMNRNNKGPLKLSLGEQPISHFEQSFQTNYMVPIDIRALQMHYAFIIMLLLLIPSINLVGLTFSKMQKRLGEMGVRRAFGATRMQLIKQVMVENLLYSLIGGAVGLLFAYLLLWIFDDLLLKASPQGETMLTQDILHPVIFIYAFCFCLLFNCLSAGIPAWRVSHTSIMSSINH